MARRYDIYISIFYIILMAFFLMFMTAITLRLTALALYRKPSLEVNAPHYTMMLSS